MGLKNKIFEIFFSKFSLEGPPGASKVFSKNSNMGGFNIFGMELLLYSESP